MTSIYLVEHLSCLYRDYTVFSKAVMIYAYLQAALYNVYLTVLYTQEPV